MPPVRSPVDYILFQRCSGLAGEAVIDATSMTTANLYFSAKKYEMPAMFLQKLEIGGKACAGVRMFQRGLTNRESP